MIKANCVHSICAMGRMVKDWVVLQGTERSRVVARAHIASAPTDFARARVASAAIMDSHSFLVVRVRVPLASRLTLTLTLDPDLQFKKSDKS